MITTFFALDVINSQVLTIIKVAIADRWQSIFCAFCNKITFSYPHRALGHVITHNHMQMKEHSYSAVTPFKNKIIVPHLNGNHSSDHSWIIETNKDDAPFRGAYWSSIVAVIGGKTYNSYLREAWCVVSLNIIRHNSATRVNFKGQCTLTYCWFNGLSYNVLISWYFWV